MSKKDKILYELTILEPVLTKDSTAQDMKRILDALDIEITKYVDEGIKKLAYKICHQEEARYEYYEYLVDKDKEVQVNSVLTTMLNHEQWSENILRYLLVEVRGSHGKNQ